MHSQAHVASLAATLSVRRHPYDLPFLELITNVPHPPPVLLSTPQKKKDSFVSGNMRGTLPWMGECDPNRPKGPPFIAIL